MSMNRLSNPSQLPQGVVEGYQQQNTNMAAARVGLDTTNPFDNGTTITIPIGGVVEVNGVMYSVASEWEYPKENADTAYWVVVVPSQDGLTASFDLVTRPGVWDSERNGCYFTSGDFSNCRTLNWVSRGTLADMPTGNGGAYTRNTKINRDIISLQRGWHFVRLQSGAGGGNGGNGTSGGGGIEASRGRGGVAGNPLIADMIFFAGRPFYNVKVGASGLNGSDGGPGQVIGGGTSFGGGGGGSGSGEESVFDGFSTGIVLPGIGGNGGGSGGGTGGGIGNNGNSATTGAGPGQGGSGGFYSGGGGGGGRGDTWNAGGNLQTITGGNGGNGGAGGQSQPEGSPGGSCNIWTLGN